MKRKRLNPEYRMTRNAMIVACYVDAKQSTPEIARLFGISPNTVLYVLKKQGVALRTMSEAAKLSNRGRELKAKRKAKRKAPERAKECIRLLQSGLTYSEAGIRMGVSRNVVAGLASRWAA